MVNYQNGKIYKLVSSFTDEVYYGSTTQPLHVRKGGHKKDYKGWKNDKNEMTVFYSWICKKYK